MENEKITGNNNKKYVLVTGAFGGMGLKTCELLLKKDYAVIALDKKVKTAAFQNTVTGEPLPFYPIECDVTDENSVKEAYLEVTEITGNLFAIIHFAGIYMLDSLIEIPESNMRKIFDVNFFGAYLINRNFADMLVKNGRIIITTSELAPLDPLPFTGIYAVTKGALDKYAYSLRMELQLKDIYVSVIRAGAVSTGMLGVSTAELDKFCEKTTRYKYNAERFRKIVDSVEAKAVPPEKIAVKAIKILEKNKPKFAYSINRNKLLVLLDILPKSVRFYAIKKVLKPKPEQKDLSENTAKNNAKAEDNL